MKKNLSCGYISFRIRFQGVEAYPQLSDKDMEEILSERGFKYFKFNEGHDVDCEDYCSCKNGCNKWLRVAWDVS